MPDLPDIRAILGIDCFGTASNAGLTRHTRYTRHRLFWNGVQCRTYPTYALYSASTVVERRPMPDLPDIRAILGIDCFGTASNAGLTRHTRYTRHRLFWNGVQCRTYPTYALYSASTVVERRPMPDLPDIRAILGIDCSGTASNAELTRHTKFLALISCHRKTSSTSCWLLSCLYVRVLPAPFSHPTTVSAITKQLHIDVIFNMMPV